MLLGIRDSDSAVDPSAFDDRDSAGVDIAVDERGALHFEALTGVDCPFDLASDDGFARRDVPANFALAADQHLAPGVNRTFDASLDANDASVSMSPSMLVPAAMIDREELPPGPGLRVSSAARASLLKIAIRWSLFHERHGIDARAVVMHFEVKVRGKGTGRAA